MESTPPPADDAAFAVLPAREQASRISKLNGLTRDLGRLVGTLSHGPTTKWALRCGLLVLLAAGAAAVGNAPALAQAPTVTDVAPAGGPIAGGNPVTISGTDLLGATSVTFGGTAATAVIVIDPTTITAVAPAHAAGLVDVVVTTPAGAATGTGLYTYAATPTVTGVAPSGGPIAGGTPVTITGSNFTGATSVTFGGTATISFAVVDPTTITATVAAHSFGPVDIVVIAFGGSGTGTGLYTYVAPPTVAAAAPNSGPTTGGQVVTITGTNLTGTSSVTFGGTAATAVTVVDAATITATTPAHAAGVVDIVVTGFGGIGTGAAIYTYVTPAPTVTAVAPSSGPIGGGTAVTITGTNLTGASSITFGGAAATAVVVVNATSITATTPAHAAGAVDVVVTTPGGTGTGTGLYTYAAAPTVTAVVPSNGPIGGGMAVTITGTNLTGASSITFGGAAATAVVVVNATSITATTPAHTAGAVDVVVTTPGGTGTGTGLYTYVTPAPTVTAVAPASGTTAGGTAVTITGTNLTGATAVTIGGVAATGITVVNATTITATTPAHAAGAVDVVVTTPGGTGTGTGLYTYAAAPTVTVISPVSGPTAGGTAVTITGTNLTGATAVTIGGVAATGITVVNATTITATTPAHAAGAVDVVVTTPGGTGTGTGLYTYAAAATVTAISPVSGPTAGGTAVTVTGTNLTGAISVAIGGVSATGITVVNATIITATTPAHAAGAVDVVVTTPGGTGTGTGLYTYAAAPTVTAISPVSGPTAGGTAVTITGTSLTGATAVTIGGVAATGITVVNATTITATTPAHAAGAVDVVVTTPGGTGTGTGLYTYAAAPTVTSIAPTSGPTAGGTAVTITGTNLTGATPVTIGGVAATGITVVNATTITATTPAHAAGAVDVVVVTVGGTGTGTGLYTYVAAPTVTSIAPTSGTTAGGTAVTITGTNLTGATSVTIGGVAATGITVVNATTITATTPAHAVGAVDVVVVTVGGTGTGTGLFTYIPTLTLTSTPSATTQVGQTYSQTNVASGGTPGYTYSLSAGSLPAGTSLSASTGLVSGTPTAAGAFSYTIKVTDSGGPPLTTTQVVSGTIAPIVTTTTLASSVNPSLMGQPVIFTATVVPASATGGVTFKDGATVLCNAVPLASGVATCTIAFTTSGAHAITAVYGGSSAFGTSTSAVLTQAVNDQTAKTVETIGKFLSTRNNQILSNEPDINRQIDRLTEAGGGGSGGQAGTGFAGNSTGAPSSGAQALTTRLGAGPDASDLSRMRFGLQDRPLAAPRDDNPFPAPAGLGADDRDSATGGGGVTTGPLRVMGNTEGATRFGFATSLSQMLRYSAEGEQRKLQGAQSADAMALGAGFRPSAGPKFSPFDIWIEGKYASFRDNRASSDLDGHFGLVSIGADYVLSRSFLVGTMVQFDGMRQRSNLQTSEVSGHGWMVGPYATLRLTDNVFWQARAAWGQSSNEVSPFLTYTDKFHTDRWLVSSTLSGRWGLGPWVLRPSASVAYIEDVSKSYIDTFGVAIPEVKSRLGQAKAGPEIGYRYQLGHGVVLEPRAGLQVIWNFAGDTTANGFTQINGDPAGPVGVRGRAEIGLRASTSGGIGLDLSGSYDGIGAKDYDAFTGRATVRVPLN